MPQVIDDDDQVDDAFNQIKEELAELMYQNLDAKAGLDLLMLRNIWNESEITQ